MDDLLRSTRPAKLTQAAVDTVQMRSGRPTSTHDRVRDDIARLQGLDLPELRATWQRLYRTPAPKGFRRVPNRTTPGFP